MKHRQLNQIYSLLAVVAVYCALFVLGGCGGSLGPAEQSSSSSSSSSSTSSNSTPAVSEATPNSSGGQVTFDISLTSLSNASPAPGSSSRFPNLQTIVLHVLDPVTLQEVGNSPQIVPVSPGATSVTVQFSCLPLGTWLVDVFGIGSSTSSPSGTLPATRGALPAVPSNGTPSSDSNVFVVPCERSVLRSLTRSSSNSSSPNVVGFSSQQIVVNPGSNFYDVNLGVAPGNTPNPFTPFGNPSPSPTQSAPPQNTLYAGTYGVVSCDVAISNNSSSASGSATVGTLQSDGHGNITNFSSTNLFYDPSSNTVGSATTNGSGTYTVQADRTYTSSVTNTNQFGTNTFEVTAGRISSNGLFAGANGLDTRFGQAALVCHVRPVGNPTLAMINGSYVFSVALVGRTQGTSTGTLVFDGSGGVSGGMVTDNGGNHQVTGGSYSVNNGAPNFQATINSNNGSVVSLVGFIGQDGTVIFQSHEITGQDIGVGFATQGPSSASNSDLSGAIPGYTLTTAPLPGTNGTGTIDFNGSGGIVGGLANSEITGGSYQVHSNGQNDGLLSIDIIQSSVSTTLSGILSGDKSYGMGVAQDSTGNVGTFFIIK